VSPSGLSAGGRHFTAWLRALPASYSTGATAHAVLNVHDAGALCAKPQTSTYLSVIAPGQRTAFPDPYQSLACPGKSVMHVNPVRPGTGVPFYTIR
jgi:hypothetical protein